MLRCEEKSVGISTKRSSLKFTPVKVRGLTFNLPSQGRIRRIVTARAFVVHVVVIVVVQWLNVYTVVLWQVDLPYDNHYLISLSFVA